MCSDNYRSVMESCVSDITFQRSESTPRSVTLFNTTNDQIGVGMLESSCLLLHNALYICNYEFIRTKQVVFYLNKCHR